MWLSAVELTLLTGLRRGELAGLFWSDVDFENKRLTVRRNRLGPGLKTSEPKSASSNRTITLSPRAIGCLVELRAIQQGDRAVLGSELHANFSLAGDGEYLALVEPGGVAIATALMPPLGVVGFGLATANWTVFSGALLLYVTNLMTIALVATTMARIYGFSARLSEKQTRWQTDEISSAAQTRPA
jgi:hypothetical protein